MNLQSSHRVLLDQVDDMHWQEPSNVSYKQLPRYQVQQWMWLIHYKYFPFELFFAVADSLKYVQFVYMAKWVNRQHLITVVGFWFMLFGTFNMIAKQIQTQSLDSKSQAHSGESVSQLMSDDLFHQGMAQIFTGFCLLICAVLQYQLATLDPLDSDLIINEQCVNLSAMYNLARVHKVIQK